MLPAESTTQPTEHYQPTSSSSHTKRTATFLDPKQVLFFPLSSTSSSSIAKARPRDPLEFAKEQGCYWRDPAVAFYRTNTEEEIRKRWEEERGELTRGWKKRSREAGKVRRRRKGGIEDGLEWDNPSTAGAFLWTQPKLHFLLISNSPSSRGIPMSGEMSLWDMSECLQF